MDNHNILAINQDILKMQEKENSTDNETYTLTATESLRIYESKVAESRDATTDSLGNQDPSISNFRRCLETLCIYMGTFMVGYTAALFGPTLVHIALLYDTDISTASGMFLFFNGGYFFGSLATGLIFDRLNWHLQNGVVFVVLGLSICAAPHMSTIYLYQMLIGINGFCQGYVYTAIPSQLFTLWHDTNIKGPVVQTCYALYSIGCVVSPYITLPFLAELSENCRALNNDTEEKNKMVANNTMDGVVYSNEDIYVNKTINDFEAIFCNTDVSDVRYAFHIIGIGSFLSAFSFLLMFLITGPSIKSKSYCKIASHKGESTSKETHPISKSFHYSLLSAMTVYFYFYYCYLYLPLVLVATFVITGLGWNVSEGPIQTSFYTGAVGIGRLLSIPLTYYVSPNVMIPILTLISIASYITLAFSETLNEVVIRICIITAGLGSSSMQSFTLLWLSRYVTINSFIGSLLIMSSSVAGFSAAFLVGYLMEFNHMWFVYVCLVACAMTMVCFMVMNMIVKLCHRVKDRSNGSFDRKEIEKCLDND